MGSGSECLEIVEPCVKGVTHRGSYDNVPSLSYEDVTKKVTESVFSVCSESECTVIGLVQSTETDQHSLLLRGYTGSSFPLDL